MRFIRAVQCIAVAMACFAVATLAQEAEIFVNSRCVDSACSSGCQFVQQYVVGDCFRPTSSWNLFAMVTSCPLGGSVANITLYSDANCQSPFVVESFPIGPSSSNEGGGCNVAAQASWFANCVDKEEAAAMSEYERPKPRVLPRRLRKQQLHHSKAGAVQPAPLPPVFERHCVFFRLDNSTTPETYEAVDALYRAIPSKAGSDYVLAIEGGIPNSLEGFQQGMQLAYSTTYVNVTDRDFFVGRPFTFPFDPNHDFFKSFVGPHILRPIEQGLINIDWLSHF